MPAKTHQTKPSKIFTLILVLICVTTPINGEESRKLDETTNGNEKCSPCEGGSTPSPPIIEYLSPPPPIIYPSPPPPSPPPPYLYSSPPPPSPKKPPSSYCPPPPSSAYLYMTGPPGDLYPVDENFSGASPNRHQNLAVYLPLSVVVVLSMMIFW
ncbi:extensin-like [Vigna umbellata]|uniref:extensin-like n=1 Tax=Vigna umbellata TaxID=87088 RepID=UPI001F5F1595|nr:extensin-like [Vigna umbellata]